MDQNKINEVIEKFFNSLKSEENKILETGFVKWFLNGSMYLLEEDDELLDIEEMLRLAR